MQLNVFISLLWLFDATCIYIENQNLKNEEGRTQSFLERVKFYAEWNNYSYAALNGGF